VRSVAAPFDRRHQAAGLSRPSSSPIPTFSSPSGTVAA
jgi:hypothetical protein